MRRSSQPVNAAGSQRLSTTSRVRPAPSCPPPHDVTFAIESCRLRPERRRSTIIPRVLCSRPARTGSGGAASTTLLPRPAVHNSTRRRTARETRIAPATIVNLNLSSLDGTNGFKINGAAANDQSGLSVSGAGDVNGDGFDDMLIGIRHLPRWQRKLPRLWKSQRVLLQTSIWPASMANGFRIGLAGSGGRSHVIQRRRRQWRRVRRFAYWRLF